MNSRPLFLCEPDAIITRPLGCGLVRQLPVIVMCRRRDRRQFPNRYRGDTGVHQLNPLTNQTDGRGTHRTGDYSYIALYPAAALRCVANEVGILEGETAGPAAGTWGTHVGIVKHC